MDFAAGMAALSAAGADVYLELGPSHTLVGMGRACGVAARAWLPSLVRGHDAGTSLGEAVAGYYAAGGQPDWAAYYAGRGCRRISVPTYPFQGKDYRIKGLDSFYHPSLGRPVSGNKTAVKIYKSAWVELDFGLSKETQTGGPLYTVVCFEKSDFIAQLGSVFTELGGEVEILCIEDFPACDDEFRTIERLTDKLGAVAPNRTYSALLVLESDLVDKVGQDADGIDSAINDTRIFIDRTICVLKSVLESTERAENTKLHIVTRGQYSPASASGSTGLATVGGLGKTIAHEHPDIFGSVCDISQVYSQRDIALLFRVISNPGVNTVTIRNGQVFRQVLSSVDLPSRPEKSNRFVSDEAAYIVTGGLGSLGYSVARTLASGPVGKIFLIGRSELDQSKQQKLSELERLSPVEYVRLDIADYKQVALFFDSIRESSLPVKGIVHTAGILKDGVTSQQRREDFYSVFPAKVQGAWNLHRLSKDLELSFFVLFSSVAATFGSPGQGNYACANSFLEQLSRYRRSAGLASTTINWGAWAVGMADKLSRQDKLRLEKRGVGMLDADVGSHYFEAIVTDYAEPVIDIVSIDFEKYVRSVSSPLVKSMAAPLIDTENLEAVGDSPDEGESVSFKEKIKGLDEKEVVVKIREKLRTIIVDLLGDESDSLLIDEDLLEKGFDSLVVMDLANAVQKIFDIAFFPREFYTNSTIEKLSQHIAREINLDFNDMDTGRAIDFSIKGIAGARGPDEDENEEKLPSSIFLLSSPRAGSTLLRAMLAGHSHLFAPPELHLLPYHDITQRNSQLEASLQSGLQRAFMELYLMDAEASGHYIEKLIAEKCTIRSIYQEIIQSIGEKTLVDKSPTYAVSKQVLRRAETLFRKPKYIHLVRHPYSVIESFVRIRMDKFASILSGAAAETPYEIAEKSWTISNRNIIEFMEENALEERLHLVNYEKLVNNPIDELVKLCEFLDIPFEQSLLEPFAEGRMTDGIHSNLLSVGDPNFDKRKVIDAELANAWKNIELPRVLDKTTFLLAQRTGYTCEKEKVVYKKKDNAFAMREKVILYKGTPLCVCEWGDKNARPVVLLHGILEQGMVWDKVAQQLAGNDYRVVAPDLRGHARSEWSGSLHLVDFVADVNHIVTQYVGQPVSLVGHSFGSLIACLVAYSLPEWIESTLLVESFVPKDDGRSPLDFLEHYLQTVGDSAYGTEFDSVEEAADRLKNSYQGIDGNFAAALAGRLCKRQQNGKYVWSINPGVTTRAINSAGFGVEEYRSVVSSLSRQQRLHFFFGERSRAKEAVLSSLKEHAKGLDVRMLPGEHNLHIESPQLLAQSLLEILQRESGGKNFENTNDKLEVVV
ncbi:alpha/beta fold hydrolase [Exilibacterium tricleocarpae]|uniref:alpha/beta fold hydrolase n=1 Tax=Exilibacterium tricleocarpae TaxID=2591008 RepID=UPI001C5547AD|nr:alpha/beta fold hydrolase [Exilibacterium tricleocarpae]